MSEARPGVVVCVRPGTELAFDAPVLCDRVLRLLPARKYPHKVARFRQVNMHQAYTHHDALEFPDGTIVMVTNLRPGQRATVLQLPARALEQIEAAPLSAGRMQMSPGE